MAKTQAQIKREIDGILAGGGDETTSKFWPGGTGGGGSRRKRPGSAVVRPHAMTSPKCDRCHRFHTQEECARHGGKPPAKAKAKAKARPKPKAKKAAGIKPRPKKTKPKKSAAKAKARTKVKARARKLGLHDFVSPSKKIPISGPIPRARTRKMGLGDFIHPMASQPTGSLGQDPLPLVLNAVKTMPQDGRFGEKVFISAIWEKIKGRVGMASMAEFKAWLLEQNRIGNLTLVRADLIAAMPIRLVNESEITNRGATFHAVLDRTFNY